MMSTAAHPSAGFVPAIRTQAVAHAPGARVPWYIWTGAAAITSATIGGSWDVAWHRSIGRDTFWTPAHLMIHLCGVLAGIVGLWLLVRASTNRDPQLRAASVSVFGLHAPLGVFFAGWGGVAMLTSAPFDNWWHNAYGLDVKIVSPPHALLILGIRAVGFGILLLTLAEMNRAAENHAANYKPLRNLLLYTGGLSVCGSMFFVQEYTWDVVLHRAAAYIALAIAVPVMFALYFQITGYRWAATTTAAIYMAVLIGEILIYPLFPAQAKLGPVFNPVTHLVPAKFPPLILVPAFLLDLLWQRTLLRPGGRWKFWQVALVSGLLFTAALVCVEWPFARFLMSKASENRFFGTLYFDYNARANGYDRMRLFVHPEHGWPLIKGLLWAVLAGFLSTWAGLRGGRWMRGVQR
jgi:predicted membrane channel-forming protein YqfA (hemolysin III family)